MRTRSALRLAWMGALALSVAGVGARAEEVGSEAPGVPASEVFSLREQTRTYLFTAGEAEGERVQNVLSPIEGEADRWQLVLHDHRRTILEREPGGRIGIVSQTQLHDGTQAVFAPKVTLLPATLRADEVIVERGDVAVYDAIDNSLTDSGTYEHRVEVLGLARVDTPAGTFLGQHVRLTQALDLSLAEVTTVIDLVFSREHGRVFQQTFNRVEKLGFFDETSLERIELAEQP